MDFVAAISTGASTKFICEEYAYSFMAAVANDPHNWLCKVSHHFVGQCFKVLGLNFNISVEDFQKTYDHPYRNDNLNYIFHPVPFVLQGVESFLDQLPLLLAQYGRILAKDSPSSGLGNKFYDLTQPVPCYLCVLSVWTNVALVMSNNLKLENSAVDKFLCEPLARLSFSILHGLVKLLPDFAEQFEQLKDICLKLTVIVRYGIFYEATHQVIMSPMLDIFNEHFLLFCNESKSALIFTYCVFSCKVLNKSSYIKVYGFLELMLKKLMEGQQRDDKGNLYLHIFTNELITDKYLAIQFEGLKSDVSNVLLTATLQYLETLQRHLVSVEVIPRRFLEQILLVLLHGSHRTSAAISSAAKLYITLARRQYHEVEIFAHILETFLKTQHSTRKCVTYEKLIGLLKNYIRVIMEYFPTMRTFKSYFKLLTATNVRDELMVCTAQSMCALFQLYTEQYADLELASDQVHKLLGYLPSLIRNTRKRPEVRGILFGIYSAVDFRAVEQLNPKLICDLESYFLKIFVDDGTLRDAEFMLIFPNLCRSIEVSGNEYHLVSVVQILQEKFTEISVSLLDQEANEVQPEILQNYTQCVRCIYALLKANKMRVHQVCNMYETLASQLLGPTVVNDSLVLYGYESLALMLALMHRERDDLMHVHEHDATVAQLAQELLEVCVRELCNLSKNLPKAKAYFCSILVLQLGFNHCLTLNALTYDILLEQLFHPSLTLKAQGDTLAWSYVQEMHELFQLLHGCERISLPNQRIWRPLLKYKMSSTMSDFLSCKLEQLIIVLIKHRTETYPHCLSVIHLHVPNERSLKKRTTAALTSHLQLIDEHSSARESWIIRFYIFISSLKLLIKSMSVRHTEPGTQRQRNLLFPLQHLVPLVEKLQLEEMHFRIIARYLFALKTYALGAIDVEKLDKFIMDISAHKCRCEDEISKRSSNDSEFESELKPQPPGPLALWQLKAFSEEIEV